MNHDLHAQSSEISFLDCCLTVGNRIEDSRKMSPILSRNEKSLATFPIRQKRSLPLEM